MRSFSICKEKVDDRYTKTVKGKTYVYGTMMDNRDGPDQYGNDGFIVQDVGKEAREKGERGPIIGNWRHIKTRDPQRPTNAPAPKPAQAEPADGDDVPF